MLSIKENRAKTQLLWIGIGSICMFFAGLTSAVIVRRAEGKLVRVCITKLVLI